MAETPEDQALANATQRQTDENAATIAKPQTVAVPQQPPDPRENHETAYQRRWTNDPAMFLVTLAGVLAVIAYTSVAAWQARLTRDQLAEMQRVYGPIKDTADAAKNQADIARDALVASNRAWLELTVEKDSGLSWNSDGANLGIKFSGNNLGKSPAFNAETKIELFIFDEPHLERVKAFVANCADAWNFEATHTQISFGRSTKEERFFSARIMGKRKPAELATVKSREAQLFRA